MKIYIPWFVLKRLRKVKTKLEVFYLNTRAIWSKKPVVAITGSVGKTTTSQIIAHILSRAYAPVALSCTQGVWIGDLTLRRGDSSGSLTALRLINHRSANAVVCEVARGGLLDIGMVIRKVDVSVFLNVLDNHLGIGVLKTREDIARIKSLVTDAARKAVVVNADDALCMRFTEHSRARERYLVSCDRDNHYIVQQQQQGGVSILVNDDGITLMRGRGMILSIPCSQIQDSYAGKYLPAMLCAAFAVGATYAIGMDPKQISECVSEFVSSPKSNPGRMNFVKNDRVHALITWADGPDPMREISKLVSSQEGYRKKILMIAPMSNRPDAFIRGMVRETLGVFDHYICSDWKDLRGRPQYHAPNLLVDELLSGGVGKERITVAESHDLAVEELLGVAEPGSLIVAVSLSSKEIVEVINQRFAVDSE